MKHTLKVTLVLTVLFLLSHLIGLFIVSEYVDTGELPYGIERPEIEENSSYLPIIIAVLFASGIFLLLMKFNAVKIWKIWFIFATVYLLGIAFSAFVSSLIAMGIALVLGLLKFYKSNVIIHNFTELFIYSGIAAIFAPMMSIFAASILLVLISIYDAIAVWKTKHMVKMAKFHTKAKMFAGLLVPYGKDKTALLGGGDIGFTLLFSGVVLIKMGLVAALITSLMTTIALYLLFMYSKKDRFYPAMPFLSAGCFLGLLIAFLV
jgi:presenilin-like A22 family membrane protease